MARDVFAPGNIAGTPGALCRGQAEGRRGDHRCTVFKSVGTVLEGLAAAMLVMGGVAASAGLLH